MSSDIVENFKIYKFYNLHVYVHVYVLMSTYWRAEGICKTICLLVLFMHIWECFNFVNLIHIHLVFFMRMKCFNFGKYQQNFKINIIFKTIWLLSRPATMKPLSSCLKYLFSMLTIWPKKNKKKNSQLFLSNLTSVHLSCWWLHVFLNPKTMWHVAGLKLPTGISLFLIWNVTVKQKVSLWRLYKIDIILLSNKGHKDNWTVS